MNTTPNSKHIFHTDHLYLAAFLVCRGHRLIGTRPDTSRRVLFQFNDSGDVHSAVADFMSGGQVDARQFSFAVLKLKKALPKPQWRDVEHAVVQTPIRR